MATPILDLIRAILPNFSDKQLRRMIPWFEAVSNGLNQNTTTVAGVWADSAGTVQRSFGLATVNPVIHSGTGQYAVNLADAQDINQLYVQSNIILSASPPGGAINIYPAFATGSQLIIEIWQIALTTAVRSRVDEGFMALIFLSPSDQS